MNGDVVINGKFYSFDGLSFASESNASDDLENASSRATSQLPSFRPNPSNTPTGPPLYRCLNCLLRFQNGRRKPAKRLGNSTSGRGRLCIGRVTSLKPVKASKDRFGGRPPFPKHVSHGIDVDDVFNNEPSKPSNVHSEDWGKHYYDYIEKEFPKPTKVESPNLRRAAGRGRVIIGPTVGKNSKVQPPETLGLGIFHQGAVRVITSEGDLYRSPSRLLGPLPEELLREFSRFRFQQVEVNIQKRKRVRSTGRLCVGRVTALSRVQFRSVSVPLIENEEKPLRRPSASLHRKNSTFACNRNPSRCRSAGIPMWYQEEMVDNMAFGRASSNKVFQDKVTRKVVRLTSSVDFDVRVSFACEERGYLLFNMVGERGLAVVMSGVICPERILDDERLAKYTMAGSNKKITAKVFKTPEGLNAEAEATCLREMKALRRFAFCASLPVLYEFFSGLDLRVIITREYCGVTLDKYLKCEGPLTGAENDGEARLIMKQVLGAVEHCHQMGVIHCNISSRCISLDPSDFQVVLTDFDQSIVLPCKSFLSECGHRRLTNPPPELIEASPKQGVDPAKVDMWGVGCVFYTLFSGRTAFPDKNIGKKIQSVKTGKLVFQSGTKPEIKNLVLSLLSYLPRDRLSLVSVQSSKWITSSDHLINFEQSFSQTTSFECEKLEKVTSLPVVNMKSTEIVQSTEKAFSSIEEKLGCIKNLSRKLFRKRFRRMAKEHGVLQSTSYDYEEQEEHVQMMVSPPIVQLPLANNRNRMWEGPTPSTPCCSMVSPGTTASKTTDKSAKAPRTPYSPFFVTDGKLPGFASHRSLIKLETISEVDSEEETGSNVSEIPIFRRRVDEGKQFTGSHSAPSLNTPLTERKDVTSPRVIQTDEESSAQLQLPKTTRAQRFMDLVAERAQQDPESLGYDFCVRYQSPTVHKSLDNSESSCSSAKDDNLPFEVSTKEDAAVDRTSTMSLTPTEDAVSIVEVDEEAFHDSDKGRSLDEDDKETVQNSDKGRNINKGDKETVQDSVKGRSHDAKTGAGDVQLVKGKEATCPLYSRKNLPVEKQTVTAEEDELRGISRNAMSGLEGYARMLTMMSSSESDFDNTPRAQAGSPINSLKWLEVISCTSECDDDEFKKLKGSRKMATSGLCDNINDRKVVNSESTTEETSTSATTTSSSQTSSTVDIMKYVSEESDTSDSTSESEKATSTEDKKKVKIPSTRRSRHVRWKRPISTMKTRDSPNPPTKKAGRQKIKGVLKSSKKSTNKDGTTTPLSVLLDSEDDTFPDECRQVMARLGMRSASSIGTPDLGMGSPLSVGIPSIDIHNPLSVGMLGLSIQSSLPVPGPELSMQLVDELGTGDHVGINTPDMDGEMMHVIEPVLYEVPLNENEQTASESMDSTVPIKDLLDSPDSPQSSDDATILNGEDEEVEDTELLKSAPNFRAPSRAKSQLAKPIPKLHWSESDTSVDNDSTITDNNTDYVSSVEETDMSDFSYVIEAVKCAQSKATLPPPVKSDVSSDLDDWDEVVPFSRSRQCVKEDSEFPLAEQKQLPDTLVSQEVSYSVADPPECHILDCGTTGKDLTEVQITKQEPPLTEIDGKKPPKDANESVKKVQHTGYGNLKSPRISSDEAAEFSSDFSHDTDHPFNNSSQTTVVAANTASESDSSFQDVKAEVDHETKIRDNKLKLKEKYDRLMQSFDEKEQKGDSLTDEEQVVREKSSPNKGQTICNLYIHTNEDGCFKDDTTTAVLAFDNYLSPITEETSGEEEDEENVSDKDSRKIDAGKKAQVEISVYGTSTHPQISKTIIPDYEIAIRRSIENGKTREEGSSSAQEYLPYPFSSDSYTKISGKQKEHINRFKSDRDVDESRLNHSDGTIVRIRLAHESKSIETLQTLSYEDGTADPKGPITLIDKSMGTVKSNFQYDGISVEESDDRSSDYQQQPAKSASSDEKKGNPLANLVLKGHSTGTCSRKDEILTKSQNRKVAQSELIPSTNNTSEDFPFFRIDLKKMEGLLKESQSPITKALEIKRLHPPADQSSPLTVQMLKTKSGKSLQDIKKEPCASSSSTTTITDEVPQKKPKKRVRFKKEPRKQEVVTKEIEVVRLKDKNDTEVVRRREKSADWSYPALLHKSDWLPNNVTAVCTNEITMSRLDPSLLTMVKRAEKRAKKFQQWRLKEALPVNRHSELKLKTRLPAMDKSSTSDTQQDLNHIPVLPPIHEKEYLSYVGGLNVNQVAATGAPPSTPTQAINAATQIAMQAKVKPSPGTGRNKEGLGRQHVPTASIGGYNWAARSDSDEVLNGKSSAMQQTSIRKPTDDSSATQQSRVSSFSRPVASAAADSTSKVPDSEATTTIAETIMSSLDFHRRSRDSAASSSTNATGAEMKETADSEDQEISRFALMVMQKRLARAQAERSGEIHRTRRRSMKLLQEDLSVKSSIGNF